MVSISEEISGSSSDSETAGMIAATPAGRREIVVAPLFLLAPPRSFTSVVCAMLGQHPQLYALSELQVFQARSIAHWFRICALASFTKQDGLLRVVAELCFGGQTEYNVECARGWLARRSHWSVGLMVEELARRVYPKVLVEKSPSLVYLPETLKRTLDLFPQARFLHLTRHPIGQGESVMKAIRDAEKSGPVPYWLLNLASYPYLPKAAGPERVLDIDPQRGWYELNMNIIRFWESIPAQQKMRMRGEDVLNDPDRFLPQITSWLGLRSDAEASEMMKHPDRSPYATYGPPNAKYGNDLLFLADPYLRSDRAQERSLDEQLSWRAGQLSPAIRNLAQQFGYA